MFSLAKKYIHWICLFKVSASCRATILSCSCKTWFLCSYICLANFQRAFRRPLIHCLPDFLDPSDLLNSCWTLVHSMESHPSSTSPHPMSFCICTTCCNLGGVSSAVSLPLRPSCIFFTNMCLMLGLVRKQVLKEKHCRLLKIQGNRFHKQKRLSDTNKSTLEKDLMPTSPLVRLWYSLHWTLNLIKLTQRFSYSCHEKLKCYCSHYGNQSRFSIWWDKIGMHDIAFRHQDGHWR